AGYFFFQAEDGIRDFHVTGVQTCALPISRYAALASGAMEKNDLELAARYIAAGLEYAPQDASLLNLDDQVSRELQRQADDREVRSEERRVGKECGTGQVPEQ